MNTVQSDRENAQEFCDMNRHVWTEGYYGYRCDNCNLFIPYGCEPWIDEENDYGEFYEPYEWSDDE